MRSCLLAQRLLRHCSQISSTINASFHGMPKPLIQTKLSFSSQSDSEASKKPKQDLKRKSGDSDGESSKEKSAKMNYAKAAGSNLNRPQRNTGQSSYGHTEKQYRDNAEEFPSLDSGSGKSTDQGYGAGRGKQSTWAATNERPGSQSTNSRPTNSRPASQSDKGSSRPESTNQPNRVSPYFAEPQSGPSSNPHKDDNTALQSENPPMARAESSTSHSQEDSQTQHLSNSPDLNDSPDATSDQDDMEVDDDAGIQTIQRGTSGDWKGTPIKQMKRAPKCYEKPLPELRPSKDHLVFFEIPPGGWQNEPLKSYPHEFEDAWDDAFVYMPCSPQNRMPSQSTESGSSQRWEKIKLALEQDIPGVVELEAAILSYNAHYKRRWKFDVLFHYFEAVGQKAEDKFFQETLPKIQKLALQLPKLCTKRIPILKKFKNKKLTFSQQQIACLLANAFFCTFPKRNVRFRGNPLPDINFSNLFTDSRTNRKIEKMKCIINYFERVTEKMPLGTVSYARQYLDFNSKPDWFNSKAKFTKLYVSTSGTIEDDGEGMLQTDFANKYVGGGVLGNGLVQEEIRFILCPEMIISRLFTEVLQDEEVLIMTGCERFSDYEGYADSFKFKDNYVDTTLRDEWGRRYTEVVAMDALVVRDYKSQFEKGQVVRELTKAYCAFKGNEFHTSLPAVRTGNWGCGAFGGDKHLKALIQMIAASMVGRDVCYFTFGDRQLCDEMAAFHELLVEEGVSTKDALGLIKTYLNEELNKYSRHGKKKSLFQFMALMFGKSLQVPRDYDSDSHSEGSDSPNESYDYKTNTP